MATLGTATQALGHPLSEAAFTPQFEEAIVPAPVLRGDEDATEPEPLQLRMMADAISNFLIASGVDTADPHLQETPARVAKAYSHELLSGYRTSLQDLFKTFEEPNSPVVIVRDIPVYSLCAHHMLPFFGTACIAYQPVGRIVGLSKLARVVDCLSRRLQVQERLTRQIAEVIETYLEPAGVAVLVRAEHFCMAMRGISRPHTETVTYLMTGQFKTDRSAGAEILALLKER